MGLDAPKRFACFMERCVASHELYAPFLDDELYLRENNGWALPVFPEATSAENFCSGMTIVPIPINDFIDDVGPSLVNNSVCLDIFPVSDDNESIVVCFRDFLFDLVGFWEAHYEIELDIDPLVRTRFLEAASKSFFKRSMRGRPVGKLP